MHSQLSEYVLDVGADGRRAELQFAGETRRRCTLGEEIDHLPLSLSQRAPNRTKSISVSSSVADRLCHDPLAERSRDSRLARMHTAEHAGENFEVHGLHEPACGTRPQELHLGVLISLDGQHDDSGVRRGLDHFGDCVAAVPVARRDCDQDQVRLLFRDQVDPRGGIRGLAHKVEVGLSGELGTQGAACKRVAVDGHDCDRLRWRRPTRTRGPHIHESGSYVADERGGQQNWTQPGLEMYPARGIPWGGISLRAGCPDT